MPCFGPSRVQQELELLRDEVLTLKADKDMLAHLNDSLRTENAKLVHQYKQAEALNSQLAVQVDEGRRHAKQALANEERGDRDMKRLLAARKADQTALAEAQTKTQDLDSRLQRYQRERAKLLDQILRRDQALFLARQVIDMVEKSGVLGVDAPMALGVSLMAKAAIPLGASEPLVRSEFVALSHQQQALDDLRKSIPAMRAALRAATPPPDDDACIANAPAPETSSASDAAINGSQLLSTGRLGSNADELHSARQEAGPIARNASEELGLNPLWEPAAVCTVSTVASPRHGLHGTCVVSSAQHAAVAKLVASHVTDASNEERESIMTDFPCRVTLSSSKETPTGMFQGGAGGARYTSQPDSVSSSLSA